MDAGGDLLFLLLFLLFEVFLIPFVLFFLIIEHLFTTTSPSRPVFV
jgi:hypothetical protein